MLAKLKRRLPDANDDALLTDLLAEAGEMICSYTCREAVPAGLTECRVEIAAMLYNRMGMEGEAEHREGSVTHSCESLPEYIRAQLAPWRIARTVRACV